MKNTMMILPIHHEVFDDHYVKLLQKASDELVLQSDHDSMEPKVQDLYDFHRHFVKPVLKHLLDMYVVLLTPTVSQLHDYKINIDCKQYVVNMIFTSKENTVQRLVRLNEEMIPNVLNFYPCTEYCNITSDERCFWKEYVEFYVNDLDTV